MASIKKISDATLKDARKGGFKRKKPKKPKQSASYTTLVNWIDRWNNWCRDAEMKAKEYRQREKLIGQIRAV